MGVRYKNDTKVILCTEQHEAQKVAKQMLNAHPEDVCEEDVEIIEVPCPSLFKMLISYLKQAWR
jgi:hypothetical protein